MTANTTNDGPQHDSDERVPRDAVARIEPLVAWFVAEADRSGSRDWCARECRALSAELTQLRGALDSTAGLPSA